MTRLSVNVNKIATLRNTRSLGIPDLLRLSRVILDAGAQGITVHPRPDERHIRSDDVRPIADLLAGYPEAEYNIEGNPYHGLLEHCRKVRPTQATLVPDAPDAFTSNHGWQLGTLAGAERERLAQAVSELHASGCRVSLFIDPSPELMPLARELGADRVELYTEPYAAAHQRGDSERSLTTYAAAAEAARRVQLGINAGHDLNLDNLPVFLGRVGPVDEVSIGHALIADALEFGLTNTVQRYLSACTPSG